MTKLNDTQSILLSSAAQRDNGSLYPLTDKIAPGAPVTKAIDGLIAKAFAEERETSLSVEVRRTEGDVRFGLYVTATGLHAIGIADDSGDAVQLTAVSPPSSLRLSKSGEVLALLQRDGGATLAELIGVTGWLPHTTRAALTGLRKKGHSIDRGKRGDKTCYSIKAAA